MEHGDNQNRILHGYFQELTLSQAPNIDSDQTLKTNVADISMGLNFAKLLQPREYNVPNLSVAVEDNETPYPTQDTAVSQKHFGFISQEVKTVMDTLSITEANCGLWRDNSVSGKQSLRYTEFISLLTKCIQELNNRSVEKYSFTSDDKDYVNTKSSAWKVMKSDIYQGTDCLGIPTQVNIIALCEKSSTTGEFEIYDVTNGVVICTITFNNTIKQIINIPTYTFPTSQALIEFQLKRSGTNKNIFLMNCTIDYK